jgi:hypothetical protein
MGFGFVLMQIYTLNLGFLTCMTEKTYWVSNINKLPPFSADANYTTISGFSGGAFMADQMHVIYSDTFKGAAMLAGGPINTMGSAFDDAVIEADGAAATLAEKSIETAET